MSFNRPDLYLASAVPGSFALTSHDGILSVLWRDYEALTGMIFGVIPSVEEVNAAIVALEQDRNEGSRPV